MACVTNTEYYSAGAQQLSTLSGADYINANHSLYVVSPWETDDGRAFHARQLDPALPFFELVFGGCPQLHLTSPVPYHNPSITTPPPAPGYCGDLAEFNATAAEQLSYLSGAARDNARVSLQVVSLWLSDTAHKLIAPFVDYTLPWFHLNAGTCPELTFPVAPPIDYSSSSSSAPGSSSSSSSPPSSSSSSSSPPPAADTFYSTGAESINAAIQLTPADRANAFFSLAAQDPNLTAADRAAALAQVQSTLAYITVVGGVPALTVPSSSPSYDLPCPPGFVAQPPGITPTGTITEMIQHQLIAIPVTEEVSPGGCKPLPTVSCVGEWITPDDCLAVTVMKNTPAAGLNLQARILDCNGVLHYMGYNLDAITVGVRTTVTLPLTPGYLLGVALSALGSGLPVGAVFASVALQHTCAPGMPPTTQLAAGYVTDGYTVSWPGTVGGAPYIAPTALPGPAIPSVLQYRGGAAQVGGPVTVTLPNTVSAGSMLYAATGRQGFDATHIITDSQGNTWVPVGQSAYPDTWYAANAKPGPTSVTSSRPGDPSGDAYILHVVELQRMEMVSPLDLFVRVADGGPLTGTTTSTSYPDIGIATVLGFGGTPTSLAPPAGWTKLLDVTDVQIARLITCVNTSLSTPPDPWTFTSQMRASDTYLKVLAFRAGSA